VSKITQELDCDVIFTKTNVKFQDRKNGKIIGEGFCENGLGHLKFVCLNLCHI
jgi:hypothetical protein